MMGILLYIVENTRLAALKVRPMVRMIDLMKKSGGGDEEPERGGKDALPEKGPLRFPSPEHYTHASAPPPAARGAKVPAAPAAPSRERGSLLHGDLDEPRGKSLATVPKNLGVKQRYCPYLGGKAKRESVQDYPAAINVCYAQESQERKLLRTYTLPFAAVSAQRQREFCLSSSYARCPVFLAKEKGSPA
jgi:hypothetical protein